MFISESPQKILLLQRAEEIERKLSNRYQSRKQQVKAMSILTLFHSLKFDAIVFA